jgi:hypothetical protein
MNVRIVDRPVQGLADSPYFPNRPPLLPSPLMKLPLGAVRPQGWLKNQLELMVEGMPGRLTEISDFLADDNGWFGGGKEGWEEQGYWLRGFYDLAQLTGDERCLAIANKWIEAMLGSQDEDGYFGARCHKLVQGKNGRSTCDLWPHMVMIDAVIHHREFTGDDRVIPFLTRFFEFCRSLPDEHFMAWGSAGFGDWKPKIQLARAGDMMPHLFWLYNRTEESFLLDLAHRFYRHIFPPVDEWLSHHIVDFTQRFQYPATYYALSGDRRHLALSEYWYAQHMGTWGQQPRGIFGADELIRYGKVDPRQGFETCGMVEFAKSFYLMGRLTGDPMYADRCEDVMLNHFPASQTPDIKGLHYLTASNMPQLDASGDHDFFNKCQQLSYSPHHVYRCCQHNVAMGWPWYTQNLWQATADNGVAAWMYGASTATVRAGLDGCKVGLASETGYPFDGTVDMEIAADNPVLFPLYLRVPRWCEGFGVTVNGEKLDARPAPSQYLRIEREWHNGDSVRIEMPMKISLTDWPRNGSMTVDRGPLSYSVRIEERWERSGGTDDWPEWEVFPATPWNYGLVADKDGPGASMEVEHVKNTADQPWTVDGAPLEIRARAKRIPEWTLGKDRTVGEVQQSPVLCGGKEETIRMIPMGCARLRISCLPVVGEGQGAFEWAKAPRAVGREHDLHAE